MFRPRHFLIVVFALLAASLFGGFAHATAPVVTTYSYPFVGSPSAASTMTGWTTVAGSSVAGGITENVDDAISGNLLPSGFTIQYNGTSYTNLIVSSNSALCFGTCSNDYQNFSASIPTGPAIQLCSADYNALAIYTKYDTATATFKIRYEGHQHAKANDGIVADIWEATFHNGSGAFEIGMGSSDICSKTNSSTYNPTSGFTTGSVYLGYFISAASDNLQNQGFQIVTGSLVASTTSLAPTNPTGSYRTLNVLTATVNTPGKVTFYQQGKPIPGCKNLLTTLSGSNYVATCNWRPSIHGTPSLKAVLVPNSAGYTGSTSIPISVSSNPRATTR